MLHKNQLQTHFSVADVIDYLFFNRYMIFLSWNLINWTAITLHY